MPERRIWTDAADATIRRMRADGATWGTIAAVLGLSRNTIIERGRRLCAAGGPSQAARPKPPPEDEPNRPPLPAGHLRSWGLLIRGTILEGTPFVPLAAPGREERR